eukprot:gnl/TRDRNA2_/TRDRNA2_194720_c0_seq1.p1 gnl/TRDRNA2_/TRDRNA2_194720_c0~~gnl/TRDRNA2_/TRDRNA2_194720_c0_seq1.p1  ORF type:complete len:244 (-),score=57.34 gnl/TRDRNA2_/TRDRNA2_194720_c0_seq1:150-812(-)
MSSRDQLMRIIRLARQGKLEGDGNLRTMVNEAVKMQLDLNWNDKPYFRSALWEATWKNHEAIVKFLFEKGADINFADYFGRTPLHEAAYYGHLSLVEWFVEKGSPIDSVDHAGQTPLYRAVEGGRDDVVEFLIKKGAKTNFLDTDDVTVQHMAAFQGMPQMAWWLYYKGAWKNRFQLEECSKARGDGSPQKEAAKAADGEEEPGSPGVEGERRTSRADPA